jgi:hypothetical protein
MLDFLLVWLVPAAALLGLEMWLDPRARRQPVSATVCALIWPIYLPMGIWVACNPKKAERIRQRFGTHPTPPENR